MAAQYELLKELLNSGTSLTFGQEVFYKFYQAFLLKDRWLQYIDGVGTTLLVTAIALALGVELGSVVAGQGACTNSSFADQYELGVHYAPIADFDLLMAAVESARELGVKMPVGNLYSSDTFYDAAGRNARMQKMGVMAVEMEAAALYCTAAYLGKRALAICSISDNLVLGTELTADERQTTFTNMMKIGLEAAVKMGQ